MATYPSLPGFAPTQDLEVPSPSISSSFIVRPLQKSLPQETRRKEKLGKNNYFIPIILLLERAQVY
jgi:hypothetical protein